MTRRLSRKQVDDYHRDGFLFPIAVLTPGEVRENLAAVEALLAKRGGREPLRLPHLEHRWAYDLATHPEMLDAVEDLLGPNLVIHSTVVFHKEARAGGFVSWHQDGLYARLQAPRLLTAWIALTDSSVENGCVRMVPATHLGGITDHVEKPSADNLLSHGQTVVGVDESQAVDVTLRPGEMSLHHIHIVHGSNVNRSSRPRTGFVVRLATPELPHLDHPAIAARGCKDCRHLEFLERPPA